MTLNWKLYKSLKKIVICIITYCQYFVANPFYFNTASHSLRIDVIGLRNCSTCIASHPFLTSSKRVAMFLTFLRLIASLHMCSMRFRSGLDDGHPKTLMELSSINFFVTLAVCFGSLFC